MKIVFLGTSHGVPEANRKCSCIMVEVGHTRYLIDMGIQAVESLRTMNIPVDSVKAVFVTHMHGDHTNGLLSFVDLCSWHFKNADPIFLLPEPVQETVCAMDAWIACNGNKMREFDFRPVKEGLFYADENIAISAYKTRHTKMSYAFVLEAEGKRILFSGDLSREEAGGDFPTAVLDKPLDLAICECAHFKATAYLPFFENRDDLKQLCFTHYVPKHIQSIYAVKDILKHILVTIATDGAEIVL